MLVMERQQSGGKPPDHHPFWANGRTPNLIRRLCEEPNLTEIEERSCLANYRHHADPRVRRDALAHLWLAYGKLVVSLAARYRRASQDYDDLISCGFLGLVDAINLFDMSLEGTRLGTYAAFRIRHEIQSYLRRNTQPVCLPDGTGHRQLVRHRQHLIRDAERACRREGTIPHHSELCRRVAARVGLSASEVESTLQLIAGNHLPLDGDLHGTQSLPSMLTASAHEEAVVCSIDSARIKHRLTMLVNEILGKSERRVFQTRCMTANEPAKLEELAAELGVSSERIYQLEASAKRKIAVALAEEGYLFGDVTTLIKETKVRASRRSPNHQPEAVAAK